jgi:hypothetical protein
MPATIERRIEALEQLAGGGGGECPVCHDRGDGLPLVVVLGERPVAAGGRCPGCGKRSGLLLLELVPDRAGL